MSSRFPKVCATALLLVCAATAQPPLKACADPDNLPFSNRRGEGFENKLAELVARKLGRRLEYKWQRHTGRGFVRNVLNEGECDLLLSVPHGFKPALTTAPYYRSAYVFVTRGGREVRSYDDAALRAAKIGVQVVEEEYAPPVIALGRRGLIANIVGYEAIGREAANIVRAVARGEVDVAIVWGPLAGYYARRQGKALRVTPGPVFDAPALPLAFSISMAVRKRDPELRDAVERALREERAAVEKILDRYGVPRLPLEETRQEARR